MGDTLHLKNGTSSGGQLANIQKFNQQRIHENRMAQNLTGSLIMSHGSEEARASHLSGSMKKPIYVPQVMTQNITLMQRDQIREQ